MATDAAAQDGSAAASDYLALNKMFALLNG
jgi:hypothetical protein